jgi:hypothetical protein
MGLFRFLFPEKAVEEFRGGLVTAVWIFGVLAVGAVAVLLVGLLCNASKIRVPSRSIGSGPCVPDRK